MLELKSLIDSKKAKEFLLNLEDNISQIVLGCNSIAIGQLLSLNKKGILVCKDLVSSGKIAQILTSQNLKVKFLTSGYENNLGLVDKNIQNEFFAIINDFARDKIDYLIILPDVLSQKLPSKNDILNSNINFQINKNYSFEKISKDLVLMGYERVEYIYSRGQFVFKGDTLQITPINSESIFKIEFFDEQVEKISELSFEEKKLIKKPNEIEVYSKNYSQNNNSILDLCDTLFLDEPKQIEDILKNLVASENLFNYNEIISTLKKKNITAFANIGSKTFFRTEKTILFQILASKNYVYNYKELVADLNFYKNSDKTIYLFCENKQNKNRLEDFLEQNFVYTKRLDGKSPQIVLLEDFLPYSANFMDSNNYFIGTYELFKKQKSIIKQKKSNAFVPKINEYVVHETHGIGKCIALEKLNLTGALKDYFVIEYAGGDKFYLPSEQADSLSLYSTTDAPKLNKLGGVDFARIKEKIYKNVKELAFDLLELYAKREKSNGNVYVKDDYLMEEFENAFMYEETPAQLKAINDIKADMEGKKIMDRLVCGDVGFGKTEVAMRAIYKAVLSGKQVAFLCPTTILAEQHYKTCQKRFNGFMVKTARFNRLMPKSEEKQVLLGLKSGEINVVCGTHKLLSKNVEFKNLSLLILDEEQRFGVEDKEKIKNLKNNIDVLSLSATPIPRTLHMSLSGIRDISIIDTPPKEREPIQTFVTEYDESLIERACKQEFARNGQVLIIYNRIDKIYDFAKKISNMFPDKNIGVAHGRLNQKILEDTIMKLYSGEYQVLVSTTLIENGVDIPTANTLIVIDADKLGLSQAYQIRGRIGRSNKKAYAYFMYNLEKQITNTAFQRLSALMENTSLGSGLKIAMADLDIRGAGNVLGKEQHGNMLKVGYDLYYKLLTSAIKEIKGEKIDSKKEVKLDIPLDAYIPETYIENAEERVKIIAEISEVKSKNNAEQIKDNLNVYYGKVPEEVNNLITLALIRNYAINNDVKRILITQNTCRIYFYENKDIILNEFGSLKEKIAEIIETLSPKKK